MRVRCSHPSIVRVDPEPREPVLPPATRRQLKLSLQHACDMSIVTWTPRQAHARTHTHTHARTLDIPARVELGNLVRRALTPGLGDAPRVLEVLGVPAHTLHRMAASCSCVLVARRTGPVRRSRARGPSETAWLVAGDASIAAPWPRRACALSTVARNALGANGLPHGAAGTACDDEVFGAAAEL